ncbi:MAG TPA: HNH endonuclease, partial [Acidimicrobiales bacterium]|nr:HNH endonuclease [Acidimicrobiales bacterium]
WTQAHHVQPWKPHGHTNLDNLHLACEHHHTRIHTGDLHVRMTDGRPRFSLPDGRELIDPRAGPPRTGPEVLPPSAAE